MAADAPPIEAPGSAPVPAESAWATGLGVVCLVYALLGILVNAVGLAFLAFNAQGAGLPEMVTAVQLGSGAVAILLGVVLLIGGIVLMRRRRLGATLVRVWVVARILVLLGAAAFGYVTLPQQVDSQLRMIENAQQQAPSGGSGRRGSVQVSVGGGSGLSRESLMRWSQLGLVASVLAIGAFPVIAGWMLSDRGRRAEMETWS